MCASHAEARTAYRQVSAGTRNLLSLQFRSRPHIVVLWHRSCLLTGISYRTPACALAFGRTEARTGDQIKVDASRVLSIPRLLVNDVDRA